jgi:hypothetical protein
MDAIRQLASIFNSLTSKQVTTHKTLHSSPIPSLQKMIGPSPPRVPVQSPPRVPNFLLPSQHTHSHTQPHRYNTPSTTDANRPVPNNHNYFANSVLHNHYTNLVLAQE